MPRQLDGLVGGEEGWKVVVFSNWMEAEGDVNPIMGSPPLQLPTPLLLFSPPLQHQATPPLSITPLHLNWTNWVKHLHRLDIKLAYISTPISDLIINIPLIEH